MDDIGLFDGIADMIRMAMVAIVVATTWIVLTVRYVRVDLRARDEGHRWASALHLAVFWTHWVVGLLLCISVFATLLSIPFLLASIGMRGVRRWGWILAIVLHSVLLMIFAWVVVYTTVIRAMSASAWIAPFCFLPVHAAMIWVSAARLRELPAWRAHLGRS
jgi:hypothetical protein